ncbi:CvpA family protein [bacterium]|nr:CvpA family protein [bacterium]
MVVDIVVLMLLLGGMIAGWFSGGFREVLRLSVLILLIVIFQFPSVQALFPKSNVGGVLVSSIVFSLAWFIIYRLLFWMLKGIITAKEGSLGKFNQSMGVFFGFLKALLITGLFVYFVNTAFAANYLVELRPKFQRSHFSNLLMKSVKYVTKK